MHQTLFFNHKQVMHHLFCVLVCPFESPKKIWAAAAREWPCQCPCLLSPPPPPEQSPVLEWNIGLMCKHLTTGRRMAILGPKKYTCSHPHPTAHIHFPFHIHVGFTNNITMLVAVCSCLC